MAFMYSRTCLLGFKNRVATVNIGEQDFFTIKFGGARRSVRRVIRDWNRVRRHMGLVGGSADRGEHRPAHGAAAFCAQPEPAAHSTEHHRQAHGAAGVRAPPEPGPSTFVLLSLSLSIYIYIYI